MKLEKDEFTTASLLEKLKSEFKQKITGEPFTSNDVAQYIRRGYTPYRYGHYKLTSSLVGGIRIIKLKGKKGE